MPQQRDVEVALGFRIRQVKGAPMPGPNGTVYPFAYQLERLHDDGTVMSVRPAVRDEWMMWTLLNTPQEQWATAEELRARAEEGEASNG